MYQKWIGNIEGTRYSLLMELFGSRGPQGSKTGNNKKRQKGVKTTKSSIMAPVMSLRCFNFNNIY